MRPVKEQLYIIATLTPKLNMEDLISYQQIKNNQTGN